MKTLQRCCTVLALVSTVLTAGCASYQPRDPRDAPWDPRPGQTLFDQMPNWQKQCGVNIKC